MLTKTPMLPIQTKEVITSILLNNIILYRSVFFTSKLLGEYFPHDLMKLTCRQQKLVIERKIQLFCIQRKPR